MDHDDHLDDPYDDHYADEHVYAHPEDDEEHAHDPDVYHDAHAHDGGGGDDGDDDDDDDDVYDPEGHDDAQTLDFEPGNENVDYEPPSPSYPYPEDQQPPDSEVPPEDLNDQGEPTRNPRHVSEIYAHDAISGTELEHDNSIISEYLRSKDLDWDNVPQRTDPLNLLELPVDVLRLIVKEVRFSYTLPTP